MKTRIDIVSGSHGAGKSALIAKMLQSSPIPNNGITLHSSPYDSEAMLTDMLVQLISKLRPPRILLETTGLTLLEDLPKLLSNERLKDLAYSGTLTFVLDGSAFLWQQTLLHKYYESQIKRATIVFITHSDKLVAGDKLAVLNRIWEINRHVNLMVEPLHGIDLWRVFDLPAANERYTVKNNHQGEQNVP